MKKIAAIFFACLMLITFVACGTQNGENSGKTPESKDGATLDIDMSKYPADINDWTGKNFTDYFTEAGVFYDGNGAEIWFQNHADYYPETPVDECVGWWTDDGTASVMVILMKKELADSNEEQYNEWMTSFKTSKAAPGDYNLMTVDHLVGNVAFEYEKTILDDTVYNKMEAAYQNLLSALNVTPEF